MATSLAHPPALRRALAEIGANYAYTWIAGGRDLFARLAPEAWERLDHNPAALLAEAGEEAIGAAAADAGYVAEVERVRDALREELERPGWWSRDGDGRFLTAYFCAEFGVDESLPIYSGGLGVLAGDHLKSASELGVPLVGVGLLYRQGYFRQSVDEAGSQVERYPRTDPGRLPLVLERDAAGRPVLVHVDLAGERLAVQTWRAQVGRTPLLLLDTDVEGNDDRSRGITSTLYGGDRELRIRQELVLGVGGACALAALGYRPTVFHLNEGHSAFLVLERVRRLLAEEPSSFRDALERVRASTVFTTHTPVPAGNEVFDWPLVERYVAPWAAVLGVDWEELAALGRQEGGWGFGLTPLALRSAGSANGVSELHGAVSRRMWSGLWPEREAGDAPIGSITNGVHARTWLCDALAERLGGRGSAEGADWRRVREISDEELWALRGERRRALLALAARRVPPSLPPTRLREDALTIGFARRFATYKRAALLLAEPDRLARLLGDPERPVQILVAGKSHPADEGGKDLIRRLVEFGRDERAAGRLVFLEDYEMALARALVQGVDVWLNNPRRPLEASGTSGMKAAVNGALNVSVLDGWWVEGYAPAVGWAFGVTDESLDEAEGDARDAAELFRVLEQEVVPAFYERDEAGLPRRWLAMARDSVALLGPAFNSNRMVREYVERYYLPAHRAATTEPAPV